MGYNHKIAITNFYHIQKVRYKLLIGISLLHIEKYMCNWVLNSVHQKVRYQHVEKL